MLKNKDIICISSIDWDFIWQGHQEIMSNLAKNGNRVLFIENTGVRAPGIKDFSRIRNRVKNWFKGTRGINKEAHNLYIFSPLVFPFPYLRAVRWINRRLILSALEKWMKAMNFSDPVVWTFLPTPLSLDIADNLKKKIFIYYCIDSFAVSSASAKKIKRSEERLLKKADLVFVTSAELYNYCSKYNSKVYSFPFAVNFDKFQKALFGQDPMPEELVGIKKPIVGYIGGVHKWIDQRLVKGLAEAHPEYSFVCIGPVQTDITLFSLFKNVYFLGKKDHQKLPLFIKYFDTCIIPYAITDYTKNVYPTKLNEYLAMGKAVVSTSLPEVISFNRTYNNVVYVADDSAKFDKYLTQTVNENKDSLAGVRIEVASQNSWAARIENMSSLIEAEIERKTTDMEAMWKENLVNFYRVARRKVFRFGAVCALVYFLLFTTPFIWFLASPLRISEMPQKADAIVVFGGGVGETGSPGKSTIERARYAVELRNKGYANKLIFSSGYTYIYNDAQNMKLFALSMGVPAEDIILEEKANSTYENVIFSKNILNKNNYKTVLLVTSPYNMRRAKAVFDKSGRGVRVVYAPVSNSQFYDRSRGVRLEQIKAIMHEYLGIAYYLVKGYI